MNVSNYTPPAAVIGGQGGSLLAAVLIGALSRHPVAASLPQLATPSAKAGQ
ncbi:hypothetical protein [Chromobacterium vaccinii]|uniref:hypothetical protein n=1 Tax=Chromobacterium vaccinii TaxID=1108595 RepID=UPI000B3055EF|nr:hypothetical protein [Chromobacterium vaccinii]